MKQFSKELGKVSITPKGDWNSSIANEKLDIVYDRRNNQAYIAKQDVPIGVDIDNREYWQPLNATGYADNNFINLTAENENGTITAYESLEEAVATIFPINRRVGATLSFYNLNSDRLDRQAEFELWQFNSTDLANWENKDYWNNIYYNWNVFAGWYIDADALKNHVETPNVGQYAYVGSNLNDAILYQCRTNGTWTNTGIKVRNYISVVVSGNITIGENGNWFSDGEDTGIPATPSVDEQLDNIISKHESLSRTVQGIAATGGASTATNVTYNNDTSRLNAENAQDAIDELQSSKIDKTSILQESGEADDKVMSQKAVSNKLNEISTNKLNKIDLPLKDVKENGVYFVNEKGEVFLLYSPENGFDVSKISKDMADKVLAFLSLAQEIGTSENLPISQKAVKDAIESVNTNVKEEGVYLCNEKGEVFARFFNGKFEAVGLEHINKLEDIKNVAGGSVGQFLQKKEDGSWSGTDIDISVIQSTSSLSGLTDVNINPVEGSLLQYKGGKWVNSEISTEGMVTTDSRSNHPMYGKHFFVFGDSHTEAPGFGLWQMLCELTGAIYHTLLRKKASDATYHFFSATTSITDYTSLIDEEDTGIEVNCDGFNWAQYAHAAYTYAQSKGFHIDYILVENCHFSKWNFYNDDGSVKENIPIVLLNKTKVYPQIFENAVAVMNFVGEDANVAKVVDELGFDSIDSSFDLRYGTASQELVFSFSNGNTLSSDCVAKIHFGNDTSKTISTTLSSGMSLTDCVDAINQWAFNEYSTWVNPTKGTQGNTKILLNYSSEIGGDSSAIAKLEVTNGANLIMQQPSISVQATSWIHQYGLKDTSGLRKSSSWLRSGGNVNWSLPNAMLGAMQYMGEHSPKTKFVFLGIWSNEMKEEYKYANGSVNPYDLIKSSSYKAGQTSKKSIKDIAELFGWQYIDVDKLCGITPFNVTPTFNDYNNVHMKKDGYRVSAECIAKYIK